MLVQICVGSSCHIKGSPEIVKLLQQAVEEYHLEDKNSNHIPLPVPLSRMRWMSGGFRSRNVVSAGA